MRIRAFIAHDMAEALAMVRREMGPDAIIISSEHTTGGNLEIRAAIEDGPVDWSAPEARAEIIAASAPAPETTEPLAEDLDDVPTEFGMDLEADLEAYADTGVEQEEAPVLPPADGELAGLPAPGLVSALSWHGAPEALAAALVRSALALGGEEFAEPMSALALALETRFSFRPVQAGFRRPVMMVGPPGVGKTSACGKLAARAALAGQSALLVCADTTRAGAREQLQAYAEATQAEFAFAATPAELRRAAQGTEALVVIDAPATNPTDEDDLAMLMALAQASSAEPVLVLDAGMRAEEAESAARAFARIGARRLILTKVDVVRRKGAALAAADAAGLAFAQLSASPYLVGGFAPATPLRIARMMLDEIETLRAPSPAEIEAA